MEWPMDKIVKKIFLRKDCAAVDFFLSLRVELFIEN